MCNLNYTQAANWKWIYSNSRYSEYIDADMLPANQTKNQSVIIWTKIIDSYDGSQRKTKLKIDLENKTMYKRVEIETAKDGRCLYKHDYEEDIHVFNNNFIDNEENEWPVNCDHLSVFYTYVRDYVNQTNIFDYNK